jgi:hypothetical protein
MVSVQNWVEFKRLKTFGRFSFVDFLRVKIVPEFITELGAGIIFHFSFVVDSDGLGVINVRVSLILTDVISKYLRIYCETVIPTTPSIS